MGNELNKKTGRITELVLKARDKARKESSSEPEPGLTQPVKWPVECIVGPGLEGAIACESKIGYVNGAKGWLIYRGYDIFDLCAYSSFEEVSYLLLHGELPNKNELETYKKNLIECRSISNTVRLMLNFPLEDMDPMAALRLGTNLMRQEFTYVDQYEHRPDLTSAIGTDEDSIPMETKPRGERRAIYEFKKKAKAKMKKSLEKLDSATGAQSCYHLIAGVASIAAAINRVRDKHFPLDPDPELSHAGNFLYMMTGRRPTPEEERVMDVSLILHADHGMNASTFASMVVASTMSDIYFSVGSGIAALNGPLHGGANEQVIHMLRKIKSRDDVRSWYEKARRKKQKIMGFGHRVYKAYDPRARVLYPLAKYLAKNNDESRMLFGIAETLEKEVVETLGKEKGIFPNVDFYSGIVYNAMGIPEDMFTPIFAVSRVAGWTARVMEYIKNNRIFRPRAMYTGSFNNQYIPIEDRYE